MHLQPNCMVKWRPLTTWEEKKCYPTDEDANNFLLYAMPSNWYHTVSFSITTVALAIALGVQSSRSGVINNIPSSNTSTNTSDSNVCLTQGCVQLAAQIIATMNQSADPCEDFYQFSCGNWVKDNILGQEGIATYTLIGIQWSSDVLL